MIDDTIVLRTDRLTIRPFERADLDTIHAILNEAFDPVSAAERAEWLDWAVRNYAALARLYQPPYGDRAIVRRQDQRLIGAVGLVPSYGPFDKLPFFRERAAAPPSGLFTPELGLYWALGSAYRGQGYATEAARALIDYVFSTLAAKRVIAMTEYDNAASAAVMRRLGMVIERNPDPTPVWFQTVGILENPAIRSERE